MIFPASVSSIGDSAFISCRHLKCVDLRAAHGLRSLEGLTFGGCIHLKEALLNDELETIGPHCFQHTGLEEVVLPRCVKHIGKWAFRFCENLRRVVLAGDVLETIGEQAFAESGLETFTGPASLREIGDFAFAYCSSLELADLSAC